QIRGDDGHLLLRQRQAVGAHEGHDALPFLRALARPEGGPVAAIRAGELLRIMAAHAVTLYEVLAPAVGQAEVLTRSCARRHKDDRQKHPGSSLESHVNLQRSRSS